MVWDPDLYRLGCEEEWEFKNRAIPAEIMTVDEENGTITCETLGKRQKVKVDIPVSAFVIDGVNSCFQRHMPNEKDLVMIAFDVRGQAFCERIASWKYLQDHGGYADVVKAAAEGKGNLNLIFRKLSRGEFDCRSAGGAGYYFTKNGHAAIEAGATVIELDKNRSEGVSQAGLWVFKGDGTEVRWGDVKRTTTSFEETGVAPDPTSAPVPKEWLLKVGVPTYASPTGDPPLTYYQEEAGDIRDSLGVGEKLNGVALRSRTTWNDATGLAEVLKVEVDVLGNVNVTQAATAVAGINFEAATNPVAMAIQSLALTATTSVAINATTTLELASGGVAATHPMVYGDVLETAFNSHIHPTSMGPSGTPPVPFPTTGVGLSANSKVS